jgi:hypothetical protein
MRDPNTDERLTEPERAMYSRIYPLLVEIEKELEAHTSRLLAITMTRCALRKR